MTFEKIMIAIQTGQTIRCGNDVVRFVSPASPRQDMFETGKAHIVLTNEKQMVVLTSDLRVAA